MARGKCFILMEGFMKGNGTRIRFVGLANCFIPPTSLRMQGIGKMDVFMGLALC
jgi:hypothetical protein